MIGQDTVLVTQATLMDSVRVGPSSKPEPEYSSASFLNCGIIKRDELFLSSLKNMPKLLHARAACDAAEARAVRKLAASRHAPSDWRLRAQMIAFSWDGWRTSAIAAELGCHAQKKRQLLT